MDMWLVAFVLTILLVFVLAYLYRTGAFYKVRVRTGQPSLDTICVAYTFYKGSYSEIYLAFKKLSTLVKLTPQLKSIGIFYDDPALVRHFDFVDFCKIISKF